MSHPHRLPATRSSTVRSYGFGAGASLVAVAAFLSLSSVLPRKKPAHAARAVLAAQAHGRGQAKAVAQAQVVAQTLPAPQAQHIATEPPPPGWSYYAREVTARLFKRLGCAEGVRA